MSRNLNFSKINKAILFLFCIPVLFLLSPSHSYGFEAIIDISPNVLNIESQGTVVTVHTDIAYSSVDVSTVFLNDEPINSWKADNRGNFVAKFLMDEIKTLDGLVIGDDNTLKLVGLTTNNEAFWGEQDIKVIDIFPRGN